MAQGGALSGLTTPYGQKFGTDNNQSYKNSLRKATANAQDFNGNSASTYNTTVLGNQKNNANQDSTPTGNS